MSTVVKPSLSAGRGSSEISGASVFTSTNFKLSSCARLEQENNSAIIDNINIFFIFDSY